MPNYSYHLLNVFAETTFGGNPLCVFEDAEGLSDAQMQALALQFNLSETTFIFPSKVASARMRIFTPGFEMPFAGHPTLGTAFVVRDLLQMVPDAALSLECKAGVIPVSVAGDCFTLTAPTGPNGATCSPCALSRAELASLLGLQCEDLASDPLWVNTGSDQLLVQLVSVEAVQRAVPASDRLAQWPTSSQGRKMAYVFALGEPDPISGRIQVLSRFFFTKQGGFAEDPGTGSACANLGGWWMARGGALPAAFDVSQGEQVGRLNALTLNVDVDRRIRVGGSVVELGRGVVCLND